MDVKRQIYRRSNRSCSRTPILASNTSTIPITKLAEGLKHPERFCGIHFFNPVRQDETGRSDSRRQDQRRDGRHGRGLRQAARQDRRSWSTTGPGFLVNRLLLPYMNEALELVAEGAEIKDDRTGGQAFRHADGPDHAVRHGRDSIRPVYAGPDDVRGVSRSDRARRRILPALVEGRTAGQKDGHGLLHTTKTRNGKAEPDPELAKFVEPYMQRRRGVSTRGTHDAAVPADAAGSDARAGRRHCPRPARRRSGTDLRHRLSAVQRRADVLGRYARGGEIVEMLKPLESLGERA